MKTLRDDIAKWLRWAAELLDSVADYIEPIRDIEPDVVTPEKPTES